MPFVIVESPYRALVQPFVTYLDVTARDADAMTMVIIPEYVARHWWERLLYNQTAKRLRTALLGRPDTVVAAVPYRREAVQPTTRSRPRTGRGPRCPLRPVAADSSAGRDPDDDRTT